MLDHPWEKVPVVWNVVMKKGSKRIRIPVVAGLKYDARRIVTGYYEYSVLVVDGYVVERVVRCRCEFNRREW